MDNVFRPDVPIYLQLMDIMQMRIATGQWEPGGKIPSVRDLAMEFGVNPNTMQRSLGELERLGLLHAERTAGRFVTSDTGRIAQIREEMAMNYVKDFLKKMSELRFSQEQIRKMMEKEVENHVKPCDNKPFV